MTARLWPPGSDVKGYSQALLDIDGEGRGMEVEGLEQEGTVLENEISRGGAGVRGTKEVVQAGSDDD